jgi:hypothetical protein
MRGQPRISPIYSHGPSEELLPSVAEKQRNDAMALAWRRHGLLVIDPTDIEDDWLRQALMNLGNTRYGKQRRG